MPYINFDSSVIAGFYFLIVSGSSFLPDLKCLFNPWYIFYATLVCFFNSVPNGEYSNLFIAAAFFNKYFSGKESFPVKNSYLLTFLDNKAEILAFCMSKSFWALYSLI